MTTTDPSDEAISDLIQALNSPRRRIVLAHLRKRDSPVPVAELADRVSDAEQESEREGRESSVVASLWHVHLPKLAGSGLIDVDRDAKTVALRSADGSLTATLDRFRELTATLDDRHAN
ncbi:DUF7344 domain-containing protein [Haloarcula litorea]|uniref:DUF7344 domain-containing protein n=1 Tax=Haloarcula litorea TaxID=3032579 RepID=UPI0023E8D397|nr:hypothetical protein [Halomicroarcula sp. GDY20]